MLGFGIGKNGQDPGIANTNHLSYGISQYCQRTQVNTKLAIPYRPELDLHTPEGRQAELTCLFGQCGLPV